MSRPDLLVLVTGTGTDVGKTWVTCEVARSLRSLGRAVAARKPAQSFEATDDTTDASLLAEATRVTAESVCPGHRWYPVALAPPMAADALDRPRIAIDDLVAEIAWPDDIGVGFVEGAGGLCSPLAHDGDSLALAERLQPDLVLLVADPALGVISAVRLTIRALPATNVLVVLNRYDPTNEVHRRSFDWLVSVDGCIVVTDSAAVVDHLAAHLAALSA
ncbi:MAG: ATP-dependent dethiobiotin synthetase BioD [Microthrixaceae bacterium]